MVPEDASPEPADAPAEDPAFVEQTQAAWTERAERLSAERGWLTLVALSWLEPGSSNIGSAEDSPVKLPDWSAPAELGTLSRDGEVVTLQPAPDVTLHIEDKPVEGPVVLRHDGAEDGPVRVSYKTLQFWIIERQGKIGVRARDSAHPARRDFDGIPHFEPTQQFRVSATLQTWDEPRIVSFPTAIGTTDEARVPGEVSFELNGQRMTLLPFQDDPEDDLFFVFADATSGIETYGGGRFLYADPPGEDGAVVLDFNRATNPPCAFTPFATCPLPPAGNRLSTRVEAGEKSPAGH